MKLKKCTNSNCINPDTNQDGLLPATNKYFYSEKRSKSGLTSRCKFCMLQSMKSYRDVNKEKVSLAKKKSYRKRKDYYIAKAKRYEQENRDKVRVTKRKYEKQRLQNDPEFRILFNLRRRVRSALKGMHKSEQTRKLIGCSISKLRKHIESQFQAGMNWGNYGDWHLDHIKPCASFDLKNSEQQMACFNYKNLQPLWASDNLKKGSNVSLAAQ